MFTITEIAEQLDLTSATVKELETGGDSANP